MESFVWDVFYCLHKVKVCVNESSPKTMSHVLAYVSHTHSNFYGSSATLCTTVSERSSHFSFIPVQRIYAIAATCITKLNIVGFEEKLLVAAPVPMRLSFYCMVYIHSQNIFTVFLIIIMKVLDHARIQRYEKHG